MKGIEEEGDGGFTFKRSRVLPCGGWIAAKEPSLSARGRDDGGGWIAANERCLVVESAPETRGMRERERETAETSSERGQRDRATVSERDRERREIERERAERSSENERKRLREKRDRARESREIERE
ncbi:hypothetical protein AAC387_Pa05g3754 [Persea americana]